MKVVRRGDVWLARLDPVVGHEQAGVRPVLVLSEERFSTALGLAIAVSLTRSGKLLPPFRIQLSDVGGKPSFALPFQVRSLSTARLLQWMYRLDDEDVGACMGSIGVICGNLPARKADNDG